MSKFYPNQHSFHQLQQSYCPTISVFLTTSTSCSAAIGGGGIFIGFKNSLQLSEVTTLTSYESDAEMIWGKLHIHNQKPLHICSLYMQAP